MSAWTVPNLAQSFSALRQLLQDDQGLPSRERSTRDNDFLNALNSDLPLITRNEKDFTDCSITVINPFA